MGSGLGQQADQQAPQVQHAGGRAQAGPGRAGGQEEELPLAAQRLQRQLLPQLLRAQGVALILRGDRRRLGGAAWPRARGLGAPRVAARSPLLVAGRERFALAGQSLGWGLMGSGGRHALGCLPGQSVTPWGFWTLVLLRELVSWAMGRRPNEEWDRLWETAPRARVLQELGDLGGSDFPLESHGRGNLAGNTPRGAAGGHPPACWPAPPAAAGAPGPAARAAPGGPSAGAPCPRSPPRRPARGPRSGNGTSTLAGSGCRRLRETGRISAST